MAPKDARFARLSTDPRFLRPSKASQKVVLDDRFKSLLEDDAGDETAKVDKYGKKVAKGKNKEALKSFYRLDEKKKGAPSGLDLARGEGLVESSSEDEEDVDEDEKAVQSISEEDSDGSEDEGDVQLGSTKTNKELARRERAESEGFIDLDEDVPVASTSALQEAAIEGEVPLLENTTKRIAVVNLDWDNVRAIDLYKVFDSVLSSSASSLVDGTALGSRKSKSKIAKGSVANVRIYPSDFGKKRMEREEREGPPIEIFSKKKKATNVVELKKSKVKKATRRAQEDEGLSESEDEDQEEYDEVALRRYQLERLRYYYAVVTFDTVAASQHAYDEIDGSEYEATANIFDLRFVPDDVTFDDEPTDQVTSASADLESYKPGEFVTAALRDSKVKLTWDQDDPERLKLVRDSHPSKDKKQKGKSKKEEEIDYSALLASDSEDDVAARSRMRAAFGLGEEPADADEGDSEDDADMEVTFGPALDGEGDGLEDDENGQKDETSLEAYQRKERERRLRKKEKRMAEKKKSAGHGRVIYGEDDDSDPDEAFDANAFGEAEGLDSEEGGADDFFEHDEEGGQSAAEADEAVATFAKLSKKAQKQLGKEAKAKEAAQLSLLVGGSDGEGDESGDDGRHFDMQAILRAEKVSSKPKKMLKKGKDRRKHEDAKKLLQREEDKFEIDLKDDRFTKLHEDHEFALDPSSAKYVKTKNMQRILDESRKRRSNEAPIEGGSTDTSNKSATGTSSKDGLSSLVESIKRKSQSSSMSGPKSDKQHKKKKQKTA